MRYIAADGKATRKSRRKTVLCYYPAAWYTGMNMKTISCMWHHEPGFMTHYWAIHQFFCPSPNLLFAPTVSLMCQFHHCLRQLYISLLILVDEMWRSQKIFCRCQSSLSIIRLLSSMNFVNCFICTQKLLICQLHGRQERQSNLEPG